MSNLEQINSRLAMQSAALATMGACLVWDAAVSRWLRWSVLAAADLEYGAMSQADEESIRRRASLEERHGQGWRDLPHLKATVTTHLRAGEQASERWTDDYCRPQWEAAREVTTTPAPTVAAAVFKAMLIESDEVWCDGNFNGDAMAILHADFARVAP